MQRSPLEPTTPEGTDRPLSTAVGTRAAGWPPSNYAVLFAVVFLVGTAIATVVSTTEAANRLGTYAFYAMTVGVTLRLVEQVAGRRMESPGSRLGDVLEGRVDLRRLRSVLGLTIPLTAVAGTAVTLWQWSDPAVLVSETYLVGWLLAIGSLVTGYVVTRSAGGR